MTTPHDPAHETPGPVQAAAFRAIVTGRVQGVGFRHFVYSRGRQLQLNGAVFNRTDGTVEVHAGGERGALDALLAALHRGPTMARVDHVSVDWNVPAPPGEGFRVTRD